MTATVYLFEDDHGRPVYAGVTENYRTRWKWHRSSSPWFPEVAYVSLAHYETREAAEAAEAEMIRILRPRFNVMGNPAWLQSGSLLDRQEWVRAGVVACFLQRAGLPDSPKDLQVHTRAAGIKAVSTADLRAHIARMAGAE